MALLGLSADEVLSTTRAVRKRLDLERPVPLELIAECVGLAQQAPTGSNVQGWHFVVVTDAAKRAAIGELYGRAFAGYRQSPVYAGAIKTGDPARDAQQERVGSSADYLAEHMGEAPALVIPCVQGRAKGAAAAGLLGGILPAAWSFMLAARARGLGTCWTTLHLMYEQEAAEILGIPYESVTQALLTPVAFTKGTDFKPARRPDPMSIIHVDGW
ncbi:MAG: nitroreductase family protein [Acidimicrobiales bacterium]|nr:nitroreductase family protein [Acidimicrobiales bacterium]